MLSVKVILAVLLTITVIKCGEVDEKNKSELPVISDRESDEGSNGAGSTQPIHEFEIVGGIVYDPDSDSDLEHIEHDSTTNELDIDVVLGKIEQRLKRLDLLNDNKDDNQTLEWVKTELKRVTEKFIIGLEELQNKIAEKVESSDTAKKIIEDSRTAVNKITENMLNETDYTDVVNGTADLNPTVTQVLKEIKEELTSLEFVDKAKSTLSDVAEHLKAGLGHLQQIYQIISVKTESPEVAEKINEESSLAGTSTGTNSQNISEEVDPRSDNQKTIGLMEGFVQTYKDLSKTVEDAALKSYINRFTIHHLALLKNKLISEKIVLKKQLESDKETIDKIHQASVEVSSQIVEQPAETNRKVD
ncbi:uncharacterized protein LOC126842016 [Adelges cooleyi]|uniref:uncharacterized protein LOC126842016 n=1 Tax=Adelges cooleyi TaxID=133065 RepID=UPI00217F4DF4|nr:uncharacterized protein LOC126842016 [Adelges cooleyi]